MLSIFLSYSDKDVSYYHLTEIAHLLRDKPGVKVYYWEEDCGIGKPIDQYMEEGIEKSDLVLFFWSKNARESSGVSNEKSMAATLGKKLVPIYTEGGEPLTPFLKSYRGIKFHPEYFNAFIQELIKRIDEYIISSEPKEEVEEEPEEEVEEEFKEEVEEELEEEVEKEPEEVAEKKPEEKELPFSPYIRITYVRSLFPSIKTPNGRINDVRNAVKDDTYIYLNGCVVKVMRLIISQLPRIERGERKGQLKRITIDIKEVLKTIAQLKITQKDVSKVKSKDLTLIKLNSLTRLLNVEGKSFRITSDAREIIFKILYEVVRIAVFTLVDCLPRYERGPNKGLFKKVTVDEGTVKKAEGLFEKFLKGEYFPPPKF